MTVIASNPAALNSSFIGVVAINDQDQILAVTASGSGVWQNGQFSLLPMLYGDVSQDGLGINDLGVVAGASNAPNSGGNHPVLWQNSVIQSVTALSPSARVFGINNEGVVVGSSRTSAGLDQAFEETNGVATALPNLPGGNSLSSTLINSRAIAINDSNQIVGFGMYNSSIYHPILWQNGVAIDLGGLSTTGNSQAAAINNAGIVVGTAVDSSGVDEAFSWHNGTMTVLSHLESGGHTLAYAINDGGIIAGRSDIYINGVWEDHAVIWQNGKLIDLNNYVAAGSGWVLNEAYAINDNGEIAGMGTLNGIATAYMLAIGDPQGPTVTASSAVQSFAAAPHAAALNVKDTAANIVANLDGLETIAAAGKLLEIVPSDSGTPTLNLTESQYNRDQLVLGDIKGIYALSLSGVSLADATNLLSQAHVAKISISDSSANFVADMTSADMSSLAFDIDLGELSSFSFTDLNPTLHVTMQQYHDVQLLQVTQSAYTIDVSGASMTDVFTFLAGQSGNSYNKVFPHIGEVDIDDSATVVLQLKSSLQGLPFKYTVNITDTAAHTDPYIHQLAGLGLSSSQLFITLTDSGVPTLHTTAAQLAADAGTYQSIAGNFLLAIDASQSSNQTINGVAGHANVVIFPDAASDYSVTAGANGALTVTDTGTGRTSTDTLTGITSIQFADGTKFVAEAPSSTTVTTGNVAELYAAVLGRTPDAAGLAYYQQQYSGKSGGAFLQLAENFLNSPEYTGNAGHSYAQTAAGDAQFITDVYQSLLHRAPESGAIPYYQNVIATMTNGATPGTIAYTNAELQGHAQVLVNFASSQEFLGDVQITAQHPADAQHWLIVT